MALNKALDFLSRMRIFPSLNRIATDFRGKPLGGPRRFLRPNFWVPSGVQRLRKKLEKAD
jgi:hypothetical protein